MLASGDPIIYPSFADPIIVGWDMDWKGRGLEGWKVGGKVKKWKGET